jgi:glutaminase
MPSLQRLTPTELTQWAQLAQAQTEGRVLNRIAPLAQANPCWFAVQIAGSSDLAYGDSHCRFPLMSVIKPFLLLFLLSYHGLETISQWVGDKPSDLPFNSLEQLVADQGRPRNPMINSGAILLADKLPGESATERCANLCNWLNQKAQTQLSLDEATLTAVRQSNRDANHSLLNCLTLAGATTTPELTLDSYEQICCLAGQVSDLAKLGLLLAFDQVANRAIDQPITTQHRDYVNRVMLTCGLYEDSLLYAQRIGLPIKSGVSGAVLAVVPDQGAIGCYSPALDATGNSVAALKWLELLAQFLRS